MAMSASWPRAPCAPPGPSRGQNRGEQRSWGAAVPGLGRCCAWDPVAEGRAKVVPPGVWDAARPPAPALLRIQMSHSAQALPGGPGQAGGSVGAAPPQPPHCRPRVCSLRVWRIERCHLDLRVHISQWSGEAPFDSGLLLPLDPPSTASFPYPFSLSPKRGSFPRRAGGPVAPLSTAAFWERPGPPPPPSSALSSPWASSPTWLITTPVVQVLTSRAFPIDP